LASPGGRGKGGGHFYRERKKGRKEGNRLTSTGFILRCQRRKKEKKEKEGRRPSLCLPVREGSLPPVGWGKKRGKRREGRGQRCRRPFLPSHGCVCCMGEKKEEGRKKIVSLKGGKSCSEHVSFPGQDWKRGKKEGKRLCPFFIFPILGAERSGKEKRKKGSHVPFRKREKKKKGKKKGRSNPALIRHLRVNVPSREERETEGNNVGWKQTARGKKEGMVI